MKSYPALFGEGSQKKGALLFQSTNDIHIQNTKKLTKRRLNFERSVQVHSKKFKKSEKKNKTYDLIKKFATSERKHQEKWHILQFFCDNFFQFEKDSMPSNVSIDIVETHIA